MSTDQISEFQGGRANPEEYAGLIELWILRALLVLGAAADRVRGRRSDMTVLLNLIRFVGVVNSSKSSSDAGASSSCLFSWREPASGGVLVSSVGTVVESPACWRATFAALAAALAFNFSNHLP